MGDKWPFNWLPNFVFVGNSSGSNSGVREQEKFPSGAKTVYINTEWLFSVFKDVYQGAKSIFSRAPSNNSNKTVPVRELSKAPDLGKNPPARAQEVIRSQAHNEAKYDTFTNHMQKAGDGHAKMYNWVYVSFDSTKGLGQQVDSFVYDPHTGKYGK